MWLHFFLFEIRYWLRSWMLWIFFLIIALLVFGAVSSDQVMIGGNIGNTYRNAPFVIQNYYGIVSLLALLMTTAFVNTAATRDFSSNTWQLVFSTPVRKFDYLTGRFIGSTLISVIPILGVSAGVIAGKYMPWVDAERWGPIAWHAHWNGIFVLALPNTIFIAAIIFAIAALTRSTVTSFLGGLLLLVGYSVAEVLMSDMEKEQLAMLLDPFAARTFSLMTKYWTVSERNTLSLGWTGTMLANRLIWLAAGALVFAFAYARFRFSEKSAKSRKISKDAPEQTQAIIEIAPRIEHGWSAQIAQFRSSARVEFLGMVKSTAFVVILAAALLNTIPGLILRATEGYGNSTFPVTYWVVTAIEGSLYLFLAMISTYYAGVLAWKERDAHMDEIHDALPHPNWTVYASKLVALLGAILLILALGMFAGVGVQTYHGYHRYQFGLYAFEMFVADFSAFAFLTVLAYFIHVLSPNKFIGYFLFIIFLVANTAIWRPLNIASRMVRFPSRPEYIYSDFYAYAPFLKGWTWFTVYWLLLCGLLAAVSMMLWRRGRETALALRARNLRMHPILGALALGFILSGAWVFYNTKVLNKFTPPDDRQIQSADYEKTYKKYQDLAQPRVASIRYEIDLLPETRNMTMRGDQVLQNKAGAPINEIHLNLNADFQTEIDIPGATVASDDKRLRYRIYRLSPPLAPGEERRMRFTVKSDTRGFENSVNVPQIVQNGTFFNNTIAPQIGYQSSREISDRNDRRKRGLKEKDMMPSLEPNCTAHCMNTYLSNNSDWVSVETVISTAPDQIAVAPGSLLREWNENGRRYYHYKLDHDSMNFYSFISAGYEVARDDWNGVKVEVYHLKEHPWNVPKMLNSIRKTLDYCSANFGPYTHKQARILEFPRIATFAQAFPGTMPYSESIGFIANLNHPDDIDHVFYVVAHEMGHQWWAHQVIGANMQGATLLSETMAQYTALMVMEHEYGRDMMRKFLKYEMDNYLRSRGRELLKERPLLTVESGQGYIHYRKGSVVLYYLKEMIGEAAVNRALRKIVAQFSYRQPPYPVSHNLVQALREETPEELRYLLTDLFEEITLFSNRTISAKAAKRTDGKYDVTIEVEARKFRADEKGVEKEVALNDFIEIGAFAKPEKGKKYGKTLHRERVRLSASKSTHSFTVDELPEKAGIDPFFLLIDRIPDDNLKTVEASGT